MKKSNSQKRYANYLAELYVYAFLIAFINIISFIKMAKDILLFGTFEIVIFI